MGRQKKFVTSEVAGDLCAALSAIGCTYEIEGANSLYVYARHPRAAKFRVADHPPKLSRFLRDTGRSRGLFFDIGPHAMSVAEAVAEYQARLTHADGALDND